MLRIDEEFDENENEEIVSLIQDYLKKTSTISNHKKREEYLMEMLYLLIAKINQIAKDGDFYNVGEYLSSAAYYMEEFNFKEAQQIYLKAIEYFDKYMEKLEEAGLFEEASRIANHISELYHLKMNDYDMEKKYILKCIDYSSASVEIMMGFEEPRKIAIIFFNLGELNIKIENWSQAIAANETGLEISKKNSFYDIIANIYFNLSDIYLFSGDEKKSLEVFKDAKFYFLDEENQCKEQKDYYMLSQIYQILKNISSALNIPQDFRKYSRLEAISYISLAKNVIKSPNFSKEQNSIHKMASFYRGAALCFKETENDYLEGASCFLIAANMFRQGIEYMEACYCFNDAADLFEQADLPEKSVKYYEISADLSLNNDDYEYAIEKLITCYNLIETKNLGYDLEQIAEKINANLIELSEYYAGKNQFFMAGTLSLETLRYFKKMGLKEDSPEVKDVLSKISYFYSKEYFLNSKSGNKNSTIGYIFILNIISKIALKKFNEAEKLLTKFEKKTKNSEILTNYKIIAKEMINAKRNNKKFDLSNFDKKVKKTFSNSEEIKQFSNFLFF